MTALVGFLPLWWHLTRLARREELITTSGELLAAAIGGAIHTGAVVQTVLSPVRSPLREHGGRLRSGR